MILETTGAAAGALALRALAHRAILHGLRAPRLAHDGSHTRHAPDAARVHEVHLPGPRGRRLFGWYVTPGDAPAPAVLAMHGWGANATTMWPLVPPLVAAGFAVLLLDARCHGASDGERFTSMPRFAEDIAAGLAWLARQPGVQADRLALVGHSVGAAASLLHAARLGGVRGVVSLSAFAHPQEVMRRFLAEKRLPFYPLGWYVLRHVQQVIGARFDEIAPLATVRRVRCPVLLVHGRDDLVAPFDDALRIQAAAAPGTALLAVDGDHDLREALAPQAGAVVDFLRAACGQRSDTMTGMQSPAPGR
ncbi:dipeptidyl aminopeptidase [Rubrivivax gelatinosus]|uniref:alpha/beta fold hydrolase n=1 Tax=Rubrivivax gelatinosus TaxID=28068 RepID=UPI001908F5C9|nr:dipeptidyl aminopeptidase [Rubrivivax gelatinosus]